MRRRSRGFSLVEALLMLLVLSVGLLGLGQLQSRLWNASGDLHALADASLLGDNVLETLPAKWLPASVEASLAALSAPRIRLADRQLTPLADNPRLATLRVTLAWRRPSGRKSLTFTTTVDTSRRTATLRWLLPRD